MRVRPGPSERLAGLSFLLFTLMQVPYFAIHNTTVAGWSSMVLLSPLQVTAANVADRWPAMTPAAEAALLPGTWVREALTPFLRCQIATQGGGCGRERRNLGDFDRVRRRVQLPNLVKVVTSQDFRGADALSSGAALVTLSAACALVVTVKSAAAGFVLMAIGIMQGAHQPLPPGVLVAFLCIYSGFGLGERRDAAAAARDRQREEQRRRRREAAAAGAGAGASGAAKSGSKAAQATPSKGKGSKSRKA